MTSFQRRSVTRLERQGNERGRVRQGLASSRDLARGMGGDVRGRSAEGEGSTFTVALRRAVTAGGDVTDPRIADERREEERRAAEDRRGADARR